MNNKIPLSKLALTISAGGNVSEEDASKFVKNLFSVIESELAEGERVTINGLGSFVKSNSLTEPITFLPDSEFADELNEAFILFTPTELSPELSEDELNSVDSEPEVAESEVVETASGLPPDLPKEIEREEMAVTPEIPNSPEAPDTEAEEMPEPIIPETPEDIPAEPEILEPKIAVESGEDGDVKVEEEISESVLFEEAEDAGELIDTPETSDVLVAPEEPAKSEEDSSIEDEKTVIEEPEEAISDVSTEVSEPVNTLSSHVFDDNETVVVKRKGSRFWLGMLLGFLIGLAVGIIAFLAYLVSYLHIPAETFILY